jgi:uncharacterized protein YqgC (DUF456 family)
VVGLMINVLGLPGLWLMLASAAAYAWATGWAFFKWKGLIVLLVLAILAEIFEFVAGAAGSKAAGGSKRGMAGAIIGGLIGGIIGTPIPIIGTIVGLCLGTFIGAFVVEVAVGRHPYHSTQIGIGAARGRLYGVIIKLAFGFLMLLITLWIALPIGRSAPAAPPAPATAPLVAPPSTQPTPPEPPMAATMPVEAS